MSSTPTTSNTDDSLSNEIDKIFTVVFNVDHSGTYRYEHNVMDFQDVYDAKKKLLQIIRQDREAIEARGRRVRQEALEQGTLTGLFIGANSCTSVTNNYPEYDLTPVGKVKKLIDIEIDKLLPDSKAKA